MMELVVAANGVITAIYAEAIDLRTVGVIMITRASYVEPSADGQWFAQIIDGPVLGPFAKRSDALTAEVDWLTKNRLRPSSD